MPKNNLTPLPPVLVLLDVMGVIFLGIGLAKFFANVDVLPAAWRFDNYESVLIGAGAALMLPLMVHLVKRVVGTGKTGRA